MNRFGRDGKHRSGGWLWERYGSDFVYRDGRWLYIHEQVAPDFDSQYDDKNWAHDVYVQERRDFGREARRSQYLRDGSPRGVPDPGSLFRRPHREDNARNETVFSEANVERLTAMQGGDQGEVQEERKGESFADMVARKLGERGMSDRECVRRANLDRRLLGKILNNSHYRPSRQTALALAVALELPLDEARELLVKAGYGLTHANKTDIVVEYCLMTGHTNLTEINEVLFKLDLQLLGY